MVELTLHPRAGASFKNKTRRRFVPVASCRRFTRPPTFCVPRPTSRHLEHYYLDVASEQGGDDAAADGVLVIIKKQACVDGRHMTGQAPRKKAQAKQEAPPGAQALIDSF